jgi:integrase
MGVTVKEKVLGSGIFWVFINHKGKRKSKRVGSEEAVLQVKSVIEAKLKLGQALPNDEPTAPKLCVYYEKYRQNYLETALRRTTRRRHEGNSETTCYQCWDTFALTKSRERKCRN